MIKDVKVARNFIHWKYNQKYLDKERGEELGFKNENRWGSIGN